MTGGYSLLVADLIGVAVFAASGASAAVAKRFDLFGVAFVGFVAALGGGILRDLVIDAVPPLAFADWRYAITATSPRWPSSGCIPSSAGCAAPSWSWTRPASGLFTVTGTLKALNAGVPPVGACLIGMLTAIGGGLARDLLTGEIPVVLQRDIYAVVALGGAVAVAVLERLGAANPLPLAAAAVLMTAVRLLALRRRWSAPVAVP